MLQRLTIRNYALIDSLDIEFDKGLTIITGETGAGKSIILGALSLILGQRVEGKYFFNQEKKCVVEGIFVGGNEELRVLFNELDLDFLKENILRREIAIDGKSRAFVNDTPVNLTTLKSISEKLIDIHSQHATQTLNNGDFQLFLIDTLAGLQTAIAEYRSGFKRLKANQIQLQQLRQKAEEAYQRQDYERYLADELEAAQLKEEEQVLLEAEVEKLTHAETIKTNLLYAHGLLVDNEAAATALLKDATGRLQSVERFDESLSQLAERLRSSLIELKDIADEVMKVEENTSWDGPRLDFVQKRLDLIYGLQQKHRVNSVQELLELQEKLNNSLAQIQSSATEIDQLHSANEELYTSLKTTALEISAKRKEVIPKAEHQIKATLDQLELPNAKVVFSLHQQNELHSDGIDQVELYFSANTGQTPAPVSKIASGGELSRLMLAIKSLLAKHTSLPTLIFDEIDTGISGETALKFGNVIASLATSIQVLSITHLPQIAAKGSMHFFVYKTETATKTTTQLRKLQPEERVAHIAEMLSGKNPGKAALENAKDLLNIKS